MTVRLKSALRGREGMKHRNVVGWRGSRSHPTDVGSAGGASTNPMAGAARYSFKAMNNACERRDANRHRADV
jgi:hypothetical protein